MIKQQMEVKENGIIMIFAVNEVNEVKLLHFSALEFEFQNIVSKDGITPFPAAEVMVSGLDRPGERHGSKYVRTAPGYRLTYKDWKDCRNESGRKIELYMEDKPTGLEVVSHYQFFDQIRVVKAWTEVRNQGTEDQGLEYVTSFCLSGIEKEGMKTPEQKLQLYIPHNAWQKELHWNQYSLDQLGMSSNQPVDIRRSSKTIGIGNTGNWSTKEYLPMGYLENKECGSALFWQIEHNGSWYWEISDQDGHLYLKLSGPTEHQSHWWKNLKPGEAFVSVPVSVGCILGDFDEAMGELTKYRRAIRRKNEDNETLAVIFNDYMNCLFGDPTTEKEIPLIDKAAEVGCEYFCIDCGWYSEGFWWDGVGEWLLSINRRGQGGSYF